MDNGRETLNRLSADVEKKVNIRLSKIIGQLKSVANRLDQCPRDLSSLEQFSSVNAAVGSLMRLIAKDIIDNTFDNSFNDDSYTESYLTDVLGLLIGETDESNV